MCLLFSGKMHFFSCIKFIMNNLICADCVFIYNKLEVFSEFLVFFWGFVKK